MEATRGVLAALAVAAPRVLRRDRVMSLRLERARYSLRVSFHAYVVREQQIPLMNSSLPKKLLGPVGAKEPPADRCPLEFTAKQAFFFGRLRSGNWLEALLLVSTVTR